MRAHGERNERIAARARAVARLALAGGRRRHDAGGCGARVPFALARGRLRAGGFLSDFSRSLMSKHALFNSVRHSAMYRGLIERAEHNGPQRVLFLTAASVRPSVWQGCLF